MAARDDFVRLLADCPLVAILRGLPPKDAAETARAIFDSGIRILEVPLNSPDPLASIAAMAGELDGTGAMIGAGTVLDRDDVARVRDSGGRLIVSPALRPEVVQASVELGMVSCPGFFTPTEAFAALDAGAHALKFFPGEAASPAVLRSLRAVLPKAAPIMVAGGVSVESAARWLASGANALGLGSGIWKPGQDPRTTAAKVKAYAAACRNMDYGDPG